MTITQEELNFILRGLDLIETRYLDDYAHYRVQDNQEAADDCIEHFRRVLKLSDRLEENNHPGTELHIV